jgi:hypothetical protein
MLRVGQRQLLVAVVALLAVPVSAAGCGARQSERAPEIAAQVPSATTSPASTTISARTEKWIDLKAGDCLAAPPSSDPAEVTVTVVDCATPHLAEVYLRANIPVDTAVTGTANQQCETGLLDYTGAPLSGSGYSISYLIDSEQDRTSNNPLPSTVICLLQGAQGQSFTATARQ